MEKGNNLPTIYKERHKLKYRNTECLNCYHPLDISDEYCPNCGQLNSTKKLAFNDFFNEFFAGIFAYDSRFYRTLGVLLFKPGKISKDYIQGKRVRYANPYRFYLSASIIFFLLWSVTHEIEPPVNIDTEVTEAQRREADSLLAATRAENPELGIILPEVSTVEDSVQTSRYVPEAALDTMNFSEAITTRYKVFSDFYKRTETRNPHVAMDSLNYRDTRYNQWFYKKTVDAERFSSDSDLFWNYFYSKLPFIIFFYLPIFALFIWLLYLRRPFTYMEHLIFTFHNQTTWFVLFGIAVGINSILGNNAATGIMTLVFGFYLYKAFRRFYGQGRVKTILKFIIINIIFFILAVVAALFSVLASFAIY
ncbi:DUF3667 domain-containing protein [Salinimicrobium sp. TH3]|uniref:DUF3667 domain-containing protein n=1 Tax=Salinimicrobium sp. TH3 TaxID=2997342 RepID=UPI0022739F94|nr:DUF3667 domain-containing protein [Salinimicrobium sp. TH3]MCY2688403.1 DUF3667 domain-containing protein [Salinimicrobium sp. TH3]